MNFGIFICLANLLVQMYPEVRKGGSAEKDWALS